jgi:glycosyltransferase involved in cell wall biosynthesis
MTKTKTPRICLVGPLPPPVGGVAGHIVRLSALLAENGYSCTVIDGYLGKDKVPPPSVEHIMPAGLGHRLPLLRILRAVDGQRADVVHFHFSQVVGRFLAIALLAAKRRRRFFLTLHHGDQGAVLRRAAQPVRLLVEFALERMDKIVALSDEQMAFYRSLGIGAERLSRWNSAIPRQVQPDSALLPASVQGVNPIETGGAESILVTSGYPSRSYGFEDCLELLDHASARFPCRLLVCLYGSDPDAGYERRLREALLRHPRVVVVGALPAAGFAALLSRASVYLRPSRVDSFGLAITDALELNVPCIASDACARDPRCVTFPVGDRDAFVRLSLELLQRGREERARSDCGRLDGSHLEDILQCYR